MTEATTYGRVGTKVTSPYITAMPEPVVTSPRTSPIKGGRVARRIGKILDIGEHLALGEDSRKARTDAIVLARAIAMAGLPKRRTKARDVVRKLRMGEELWLRVTYTAAQGRELPFGEDRFVLAAIQHLAIEANSRIVVFDRVGQLLEMFGVGENDQGYQLLRERFQRLSGLSISLVFGRTEAELEEGNVGEQIFVIRQYALPTRKELQAASQGQLSLPALLEEPAFRRRPFGVILSEDFWGHLQVVKNHLIVPIDLLKLFIDRPLGWDYLMFLVARCGRARSTSVLQHEVLMGLFRDAKEPERKTIFRLLKYHEEIMIATGGRLNASLEEAGTVPSTGGPGRKKKRWVLRVGPSAPLVFSGKQKAAGTLPAGER